MVRGTSELARSALQESIVYLMPSSLAYVCSAKRANVQQEPTIVASGRISNTRKLCPTILTYSSVRDEKDGRRQGLVFIEWTLSATM